MKAKRRRHDATFKARVALEAIKERKTVQQIEQALVPFAIRSFQ